MVLKLSPLIAPLVFAASVASSQEAMPPERTELLAKVEALNATPVGHYLSANNIGTYEEKAQSRNGEVFINGQYTADIMFGLNQRLDFLEGDLFDAGKSDDEINVEMLPYFRERSEQICALMAMETTEQIDKDAWNTAIQSLMLDINRAAVFNPAFSEYANFVADLKTGALNDPDVCVDAVPDADPTP